jgi:hypothetical protein
MVPISALHILGGETQAAFIMRNQYREGVIVTLFLP